MGILCFRCCPWFVDGELLAEGKVFELELAVAREAKTLRLSHRRSLDSDFGRQFYPTGTLGKTSCTPMSTEFFGIPNSLNSSTANRQ